MKILLNKVMESMVLSAQMLGLIIFGLIFIIAPNLAVDLGIRYMKFRTAFL